MAMSPRSGGGTGTNTTMGDTGVLSYCLLGGSSSKLALQVPEQPQRHAHEGILGPTISRQPNHRRPKEPLAWCVQPQPVHTGDSTQPGTRESIFFPADAKTSNRLGLGGAWHSPLALA